MKFVYRNIFKLSLLSLILSSCNHLFYYPDTKFYYDPEKDHLEYRSQVWLSPDKLKLKVLELLPQKEQLGTVLHLHGNAQNRSAHFPFASWLTASGYRVFEPDYRGYGGSEGEPTQEGLLSDAKYFMERICKYSKKPVFIFAQSLGGAVGIPALAQSENSCVCALIVDSSFSSYRSLARDKLNGFWLSWPFQYPLSFLVSDNLSPIYFVNKIRIPTLFVHGTADEVVPYKFGKELYEESASLDKELWTLPDAGHTAAFGDRNSIYRGRLLEWLAKQTLRCPSS